MATGGPLTEQELVRRSPELQPMPDPTTADPLVMDVPNMSPNSFLPSIPAQDGLPADYMGQMFALGVDPGADPLVEDTLEAQPTPLNQPGDVERYYQDVARIAPTEEPVQGPDGRWVMPSELQAAPEPFQRPAPQLRQPRSGPRVSLSAPGFNQNIRYTQEDFYGKKPDISWTDPRGAQMYVPSAGQLPMAVWASRMQQVQAERAQNKQNLQKLVGGAGKGVTTAAPYQQSLNNALTAGRDRFINELAADYGGNMNLAWDEVANNPQTAQRFFDMHRQFEAIGAHGQEVYNRATSYLKELSSGKVHQNPETARLAEDIVYGLGSMRGDEDTADINKLIGSMEKFEHSISRDQYAKEFIVPGIKDKYARYAQDVRIANQSGLKVASWNEVFDGQRFIDEAARSMTDLIPGTTFEENQKWVANTFPPEQIEKNVQLRNPPKPSKGGGGAGGAGEGFRYTTSTSRPPQDLLEKLRDPLSGTIPPQSLDWPTVNLFDIVGKRGQTPYARVFVSEAGDNVYMHPTRIMDVNGQKYIIGKETGMPRTQAQKDKADKGKTPEQRALAREARKAAQEAIENGEPVNVEIFKDLPDIAIPYNDQNASLIEGSFGLPVSEVERMLGSVKKPAKKPDVTQDQYAKLKSGDKYWYNGEEYTKE